MWLGGRGWGILKGEWESCGMHVCCRFQFVFFRLDSNLLWLLFWGEREREVLFVLVLFRLRAWWLKLEGFRFCEVTQGSAFFKARLLCYYLFVANFGRGNHWLQFLQEILGGTFGVRETHLQSRASNFAFHVSKCQPQLPQGCPSSGFDLINYMS